MTEIEKTAIDFITWWENEYFIDSKTDIICPHIKALYEAVKNEQKIYNVTDKL